MGMLPEGRRPKSAGVGVPADLAQHLHREYDIP